MEIIDVNIIDIYNFLESEIGKVCCYAIREGFAYFTEHVMSQISDNNKLIMLAYYIVNCSDNDFELHMEILSKDENVLNSLLCGVSLVSFAHILKKQDALEFLLSHGLIEHEVKSEDKEIIDALSNSFIKHYNSNIDHKEYLKLFKKYYSGELVFNDQLEGQCSPVR